LERHRTWIWQEVRIVLANVAGSEKEKGTVTHQKEDRNMSMLDTAVADAPVALNTTPKRRLDLELQNAYEASNPNCFYCGVCLVDGPSPDFEVAYLLVIC
jgi:hypothetical protein